MVIYDGIIEKLQGNGGITVVFNELTSRIKDVSYICYDKPSSISDTCDVFPSRVLERYRDVNIDKYLAKSNVFHSTYYRLPNSNKPSVVTTVHDFTYEKFIKGPAQWVHSWQKNRAIKGSDKIICVSENTANDLLKYCPVDESKIEVIYNGVSEDYHQLKSILTQTNKVVFVGARGGYKNFIQAVSAISLCPELSLSIVGGGNLSQPELAILNDQLKGRYEVLGRLSNEELNRLYNGAYCLLYPSSYEGFGIPIIESMRAGCPVIALNISSIPEVAGNAGLLINELNVNLLAEALKSLNVYTEREKYIREGLINSKRFSWENAYQETKSIYNKL